MKKVKREIEVIELEQWEAKMIKHALDYVWHRLSVHNKRIPQLDEKKVNKLRKELEII